MEGGKLIYKLVSSVGKTRWSYWYIIFGKAD